MGRGRRDPVLRTVLTFAGLGLVVMVVVGVAGVVVLVRVATDQAVGEARRVTGLSARIVEPRIGGGLFTGDAEATVRVASIVSDAVLHAPVVSVRIWASDGTILYSNDTRLIGLRFPGGADALRTLRPGEVRVGGADPSAPQNAGIGQVSTLLDSVTRMQSPNGTPLLFETLSASAIEDRNRLLRSFAPVLVITLISFAALLIPVAWGLARRLERASRERAEMLQGAIEISDRERRRIAGDLHDGAVQDLAGLALRLSAQAQRETDPAGGDALRDTAEAVRSSVRTLRSAIVGIYPPNLQAEGLGQALLDLTARLPGAGLEVSLEVADPGGYGPRVDELLYRVCREGLRNVEVHAAASRVRVTVRKISGQAVLEVRDDGRGLRDGSTARANDDGHFGLGILRDVVRDAGGSLTVGPADGGGTLLRAEVPT